MPIGYWSSRPNKVKEETITFAGGVDYSVDPLSLPETFVAKATNVDSTFAPAVQTRPGYAVTFASLRYYSKLFVYKSALYGARDDGLFRINSSSVFIPPGTDTARQWSFAKFINGSLLYFLTGMSKLQKYDGTTVTEIASAPAQQSYVAAYRNRLFTAGREDNLLHWSGLRDGDDWTSTDLYTGSGKLAVETDDGETPTAIVEFAGSLILFKRNSMHKLYGDDATNFTLNQAFKIGCVSENSIVQIGSVLYFLAPDGMYAYDGGNPPVKISQPIQPYIESMSVASAKTHSAGTDGRFLYLSLTLATNVYPSQGFKYDTQSGRWWEMSIAPTTYFLNDQTLNFALYNQGIMRREGLTDPSGMIPFELRTRTFGAGDETVRKGLHRIYAIVDVDPNASLDISYALGAEGEVWTPVYTTTNGTGQAQSLRIPVIIPAQRGPNYWYRIRFVGLGRVRIHRLITEITRRGN